MNFVNYKDTFYVDEECTFVRINGELFEVTKINLFSEDEGKFETEDYIIKFSKKTLYLYDKEKNLLNDYKFSKFESSAVPGSLLIGKYVLKKNHEIHLYKDTEYYIINNGKKEDIIDMQYNGKDKIYLTDSNNKLLISTNRSHKWNGIPIGKFRLSHS